MAARYKSDPGYFSTTTTTPSKLLSSPPLPLAYNKVGTSRPLDIDYSIFDCSFPGYDFGDDDDHPNCSLSSSGASTSSSSPSINTVHPPPKIAWYENPEIVEALKKLWTVDLDAEEALGQRQKEARFDERKNLPETPLLPTPAAYNMKVTSGPYSCWDFIDIMPLQTAQLNYGSPSSRGTNTTIGISPSSSLSDEGETLGSAASASLPSFVPSTVQQEKWIAQKNETLQPAAENEVKQFPGTELLWSPNLINPDFNPVLINSAGAGAGAGAGVGATEQIHGNSNSNNNAPNSKRYFVSNVGRVKQFGFKAWGIAVFRPTNLIYVTDRECHEIVVLNSSMKILHKFGRPGAGPGEFYRPTGIAIDHFHGRVIVTDKDNHRVSVFGLRGNFLFNFGQKGHQNGEFDYPWGVAVSPSGQTIAVADSRNRRVQLFDASGNYLRKFTIFETRPFEYKNEFNYPRGIAFSLDGNHIYVTDFNIHAVFLLSLDLTVKKTFVRPKALSRPQGLTVDDAGNILICDSKHDSIRIVSPTGALLHTVYKPGTGMQKFSKPLDVAVLEGGKIIVLEVTNRLCIF